MQSDVELNRLASSVDLDGALLIDELQNEHVVPFQTEVYPERMDTRGSYEHYYNYKVDLNVEPHSNKSLFHDMYKSNIHAAQSDDDN